MVFCCRQFKFFFLPFGARKWSRTMLHLFSACTFRAFADSNWLRRARVFNEHVAHGEPSTLDRIASIRRRCCLHTNSSLFASNYRRPASFSFSQPFLESSSTRPTAILISSDIEERRKNRRLMKKNLVYTNYSTSIVNFWEKVDSSHYYLYRRSLHWSPPLAAMHNFQF